MIRCFFLFTAIYISMAAAGQANIDVLHYRYEIELNDNNDTIKGSAVISFLANAPCLNVVFDLEGPGSNGKGMLVSSAFFLSRNELKPNINQHNDKITITPFYGFKKGDTGLVTIHYQGIPSDGLIISKNKYGNRTFFADNWPNRAHNWIPCVDDPADKAPVEFLVTTPSHYKVVSNGELIEESNLPGNKKLTHWKEDLPLPTKVMVIGVADFAVGKAGDAGCIPIWSWVFPENKDKGFYDYQIGRDILSFYINYIGPYPYKKLANVQSKTRFGGMENAGAIFYSENSVVGGRQAETLMAHEIVHQWFGDMATEKSFSHLWLSEGFATYFTHVWVEAKYGTDSLNKRMFNERNEINDFVSFAHRPVVDSISPTLQLLNTNSYQKGSWVLHMLRRELGDSVFRKCVRTYYEIYAGKNADTRDLQKIFELVSGKNLEQFFNQWLYTPEDLRLDITWQYRKNEKNIAVTVRQLQTSGNFQFPLELQITGPGSFTAKKITRMISKNTETFLVPALSTPNRFDVDPNVSLLFEGTVREIK